MNYYPLHVDEQAVLGIALTRLQKYLFFAILWSVMIPMGLAAHTAVWLLTGHPQGHSASWEGRAYIAVGVLVIGALVAGSLPLLAVIWILSFLYSLLMLAGDRKSMLFA